MPETIERLVIGNALDESSTRPIAAGMAIGKHCGAEVTVVHAYALPTLFFSLTSGAGSLDPRLLDGERSARAALARGFLESHLETGTPAPQIVVEMDAAHRLILNTAEQTDANLIVVGADNRGPLVQLLGSTSDRVMRGATCPVLVVRDDFAIPPRRILAPTDLSPLSESALVRGLGLIARWTDPDCPPTVELLFVHSKLKREFSRHLTPQQADRMARKALERVAERVQDATAMTLNCTVSVGLPRNEILAAQEEEPADLVLIGTHGRGGYERLVLGSVAVSVAHQAPGNVLVVPATSSEDKDAR